MGPTIGQVLPLALGIAASPLPVVAVILILLTPRARLNGLAFVAGWLGGLLAVGTVALAIANRTDLYGGGGGSPAARWIKAIIGVALLVLAVREWSGRPRDGAEPESPSWMAALATFTPAKSAGLGLLLAAVKPKNPLLTVAAAAAIAAAGLPIGQEALTLLVFVAVASVGVLIPLLVLLTMGERASRVLEGWQAWLARNNDVVMSIVLLVFGLILVGLAIAG